KHPDLRRILALCGAGTFEDALAEIDRLRTSPPPLTDRLKQVLELAGDDAARRNLGAVAPENLFIALLRGPYVVLGMLAAAGVDIERLREAVVSRLHPVADRIERSKLPLDHDATATVERAISMADARRADLVVPSHLFAALMERDGGYAAD